MRNEHTNKRRLFIHPWDGLARWYAIHEPFARTNVASGLPVWAAVPVMHNPSSFWAVDSDPAPTWEGAQ